MPLIDPQNTGRMSRHRTVRRLAWLIGAAAWLAVPAHGAGDEDAMRLIDRAIAAHGGQRLTAMTSVVTEWLLDDSLIFQSQRPAPPWDRARRWEAYAVDFDARRYADARYDGGSGYEWITGTVSDASGAFRLDYRNRSYQRTTLAFDDAIADAMLLSPPVLLRWLTDHRERAHYAGRRRVNDTDLEVLELSREDADRIEVLFEADSGRIHGLESGYTDYDGSRVPLHFRTRDWRESDGLHFPARIEVRAHGYVARRASLAHIEIGGSIDRYLRVADEFRATDNEAPDARAFRLEELAPGVYFVGEGVMYQLIVEFDDFLVALDGSSGDVQRRIDAVRKQIPHKPFRYVLASHHHDDHLHGLDEFAALGATILAAAAHLDIVSEYVEQRLGRRPEAIPVSDEYVINDGARQLRVIDIGPTPHSEHILVAYLPEEQILFAADLYVLGGRRAPVRPAMANGLALFEQISVRDLDVQRIVDPHSPLIATMSDLQHSVDTLRATPAAIMHRARADLAAWRSAEQNLRPSPRLGLVPEQRP